MPIAAGLSVASHLGADRLLQEGRVHVARRDEAGILRKPLTGDEVARGRKQIAGVVAGNDQQCTIRVSRILADSDQRS